MDFSFKAMALLGAVLGMAVAVLLVLQLNDGGLALLPGTPKESGQGLSPTPLQKIELFELKVKDCNQCVSFDLLKQQLMDLNKEFDYREALFDSAEGKQLIEKYAIEFAPTIIVKNAPANLFGNWKDVGSVEADGAMVFRSKVPVYWDLKEQRFAGLVNVTEITDSSCGNCFSQLQSGELSLLLANIKVLESKKVDVGSTEGKELLKKYHLDFVPAAIFSPEVGDYNFFQQFASFGSIESDGSFVVRKKFPPYKGLDSNAVKGLLSITLIESPQCWACKDAKDLLAFLNSKLGLRFADIIVIDANSESARYLAEQYSVQYAPAALIQGDLALFEGMEETWPKIGRVFKDGVYAFDNPLLLGEGYYYDFNSGLIVAASAQPA
ncbi:MAG: hypothetical protein V1493_05485 [Candidatus Diapherotrites archaeon]